mmetsp:Transcript_2788/g.8432  ORF Transcript_2788/g.8432 Transcript_2788/m.8432 type:complete len:201 (+) Transcript_2788:608-1210(+)
MMRPTAVTSRARAGCWRTSVEWRPSAAPVAAPVASMSRRRRSKRRACPSTTGRSIASCWLRTSPVPASCPPPGYTFRRPILERRSSTPSIRTPSKATRPSQRRSASPPEAGGCAAHSRACCGARASTYPRRPRSWSQSSHQSLRRRRRRRPPTARRLPHRRPWEWLLLPALPIRPRNACGPSPGRAQSILRMATCAALPR